jgi:hypothetical protein
MSAWMYNCKFHILSVLLSNHHTNKSNFYGQYTDYYSGHSSLFSISPNTTSERLDPFQSSVREKNVPTQFGPFKRTNPNHWNLSALPNDPVSKTHF